MLGMFPTTRSLGFALSAMEVGPEAAGQRIELDPLTAPQRVKTTYGVGGMITESYRQADTLSPGMGDLLALHGQNQVIFSLAHSYQMRTAGYYFPEVARSLLKP